MLLNERSTTVIHKCVWYHLYEVQKWTKLIHVLQFKVTVTLERRLETGMAQEDFWGAGWPCSVLYLKTCYIMCSFCEKSIELYNFCVYSFCIYTSIKLYIAKNPKWNKKHINLFKKLNIYLMFVCFKTNKKGSY